jgi:hypothetical protein
VHKDKDKYIDKDKDIDIDKGTMQKKRQERTYPISYLLSLPLPSFLKRRDARKGVQ